MLITPLGAIDTPTRHCDLGCGAQNVAINTQDSAICETCREYFRREFGVLVEVNS